MGRSGANLPPCSPVSPPWKANGQTISRASKKTNWRRTFEFTELNGESFRLPIEVQIVQLVGHASYHRGQIALLVDQLGGETVDTDYADWWWNNVQAIR